MKYVGWILAGVLSIVLLFMLVKCNPLHTGDYAGKSDTIFHSDTIKGDSVPYRVDVPKPYPVKVDNSDTLWMDQPVDTSFILRKYYTQNTYDVILKDDTSALVRVHATVQHNEIETIGMDFQNRRAMVINNTTIINGEMPRTKLYVGVGTGMNLKVTQKIPITASLLLTTKKNFAYELKYDVLNKDLYGTVYFKLKVKN